MAETWNPVTLTNDSGQRLNAAYFNRIEQGIESIDDRVADLELRVAALEAALAAKASLVDGAVVVTDPVSLQTAKLGYASSSGRFVKVP